MRRLIKLQSVCSGWMDEKYRGMQIEPDHHCPYGLVAAGRSQRVN